MTFEDVVFAAFWGAVLLWLRNNPESPHWWTVAKQVEALRFPRYA